MQIPGLGHVGLSVSNMRRSLEFYRDIMGMKVVLELDISDDRQARVIGIPGTKCHIAHLMLGDGVLELFEYYDPVGKNKARSMQQQDHGIVHIGFEVDDFHERVKFLKEKDVKFLGEPVEFRPGVWVLYFYGPQPYRQKMAREMGADKIVNPSKEDAIARIMELTGGLGNGTDIVPPWGQ